MKRRRRPKRLRPRHVLRGPRLIQTALRELEDLTSWQAEGQRLTWQALAARLGVSRQAVATKPELQEAYRRAQERLRNPPPNASDPVVATRRSYEQRIAQLEAELARLREERDGWIQRWMQVEHNCRLHGVDPDQIFAPVPAPDRRLPRGPSRNNNLNHRKGSVSGT